MTAIEQITLAQKALRELGVAQLWQYASYKAKLQTGWLRWITRAIAQDVSSIDISFPKKGLIPLPDREDLRQILGEIGLEQLIQKADEVVAGQVRLFGNEPIPLALEPAAPLYHWTVYPQKESMLQGDPREIWEHARFGWAYNLARAYFLTGEERFPKAFWQSTERFLDANPPYQGPNWISAQESALRVIAFTFLVPIFLSSKHSTPARLSLISRAIVAHTKRIPPTLTYARAQNNNHLLSEAAGLFTAGVALSQHPEASSWRETGWEWFNRGLQSQIAADGAYIQNSTNYHRLALQLALWVGCLAAGQELTYSDTVQQRLRAATRWLSNLVDRDSGRTPNLGPNDGSLIIPLGDTSVDDYRPVVQAASIAFLNQPAFSPGIWDELSMWLNGMRGNEFKNHPQKSHDRNAHPEQPLRLENQCSGSWVYFRVAKFHDRPGHADQLHVDLWWQGLNLAQDAGSYRYNDPPPWNNAFARSEIHNTVTVDDQDQMTNAGRFLWLDWAQARLVEHIADENTSCERLTAEHDGYSRRGVLHQRSVMSCSHGGWKIEDKLIQTRSAKVAPMQVTARLHWLLPDVDWQIEAQDQGVCLHLASSFGRVSLKVFYIRSSSTSSTIDLTVSRAGKLLFGVGPVPPTWGWSSRTYAHKIPALSFALRVQDALPINLTSEWIFPDRIKSETP